MANTITKLGTNTNTNRATGGSATGGSATANGGDATIERGAVRNNNTVTGGDQRNVVRDSGNSENTNTNRARGGDQEQSQSQSNSQSQSSRSRSSANNNGNSQATNIDLGGNTYTEYGDLPETAVAPLPGSGAPGQIGDIVVPLPNISAGAFASGSEYNDIYGGGNNTRNDYGVSIGVNIPLGAGQFRDAAKAEMRRRSDRAQFLLIQEAVWLRDNGILSEEAHPRHWAALYGAPETFKF